MIQEQSRMPNDLVARGYCRGLYNERCTRNSSIGSQQYAQMQGGLYHRDLVSFKEPFVNFERFGAPANALFAFSKGTRPEYGKSLSRVDVIRNKILNKLETMMLNLKGENKLSVLKVFRLNKRI